MPLRLPLCRSSHSGFPQLTLVFSPPQHPSAFDSAYDMPIGTGTSLSYAGPGSVYSNAHSYAAPYYAAYARVNRPYVFPSKFIVDDSAAAAAAAAGAGDAAPAAADAGAGF